MLAVTGQWGRRAGTGGTGGQRRALQGKGMYDGITVLDRARDGASPSEWECAGRRLTNTECSERGCSYCSERNATEYAGQTARAWGRQ